MEQPLLKIALGSGGRAHLHRKGELGKEVGSFDLRSRQCRSRGPVFCRGLARGGSQRRVEKACRRVFCSGGGNGGGELAEVPGERYGLLLPFPHRGHIAAFACPPALSDLVYFAGAFEARGADGCPFL